VFAANDKVTLAQAPPPPPPPLLALAPPPPPPPPKTWTVAPVAVALFHVPLPVRFAVDINLGQEAFC